ncbi:ankyrin repeat domain-containing protein [Treponema zioleckii]|uniref:ankyrin repeat domain-containing protein n=1 Tax=Treponema zioleckii TaxID=331680 RepID=UPI00168B6FC2|nr:ankyrin repeat domain-containing protein [Treponema zioleckii]
MKKILSKSLPIFATVLVLSACASTKHTASLQELILQGRYDEARALFNTSTNINECDEEGNTALHIAAKVNEADLVSFLIIKGADTEIKNNAGDTALHVAIKNNNLESTKVLAIVHGDIFSKDAAGNTALELALAKGAPWYDATITQQTGKIRNTEGQSIVHYFVKTENEKAIEHCIKQGLSLSDEDNNGKTPLALAYENAQDPAAIRIAATLLRKGAAPVGGDFFYFEQAVRNHNMLMRFEDGQTPLHLATIQGHTGIVEYILKERSSISLDSILAAQDIVGATPLHDAVRNGRADIVQMLLANGAKVNALDSIGKTPILLIIPKESQKNIYETLIKYKANVNQKDMYGDTVLHVATMNQVDVSVLQLLVDNGVSVNERNKQGVTPLALAIEQNVPSHVTFYAQNGADLYAEDMKGNSPLSKALESKSPEILKTLVTKENASSKDSEGNTPLHIALQKNASIEYVKYIVDAGADVNARNKNGDSVLFIAVQKNKKEAGELLLDKGADIFASNMQNNSALRIALVKGSPIQDWLITSRTLHQTDGTGNTPLHYAAEWQLSRATTSLIKKGAKINAENANGETPLFSAVKGNNQGIIQTLIDNGAVYDTSSNLARDHLGNTPLHAAVKWNATKSAEKLIALGIDVDAQNLSGKTALSDTCRANKRDMAILLIKNGADVNATDSTGRTILMDAVLGRNADMIKLLLDSGAKPQIQDMYGKTAYHDAAAIGDVSIINLIRNAGGNPLARDSKGDTPFSLSLRYKLDVIKAVLGTDTTIVDSDGNTPIHIAVEKNVSKDLLTSLLKIGYPATPRNGKGVTALNTAVTKNSRLLSQVLLEYNADPYLATNNGENALTSVFKTKNLQILDEIVKYAGKKTDKQGDGILHYAARTADEEVVKHLVSLNLDKTAKNISGETPAQMAARWDRPEIAALLK